MNGNDLEEMKGNLEDILSRLNNYFELARKKSEHGLATKLIDATYSVEAALEELDRVMVDESVNDAAEELAGVEEPIKITDIDEPDYPASDSWDKDAEDIDYLIDQYINDQARKYYRNGNIPEDEEQEMRDGLRAVRISFNYWCDEDDEYEAGYDEREALFIIDTDGWLCNVDWEGYGSDYSTEDWNYLVNAACEYVGVKYKGSAAPEK